jgi:hypothetical protein
VSATEAPVRIRTARPYDAAAVLDLKRQLDSETAFMMYEPGERDSSVQDLARDLAVVARSPNSVVLLAELGDQLAGYAELTMAAILPPSPSEPPSLPAQPPDMDATEP